MPINYDDMSVEELQALIDAEEGKTKVKVDIQKPKTDYDKMSAEELQDLIAVVEEEVVTQETQEGGSLATKAALEDVSMGESIARGAAQSASLGFVDELQGIGGAIVGGGKEAIDQIIGSFNGGDINFSEMIEKAKQSYTDVRDQERVATKIAQEANPKSYTTGQIAGFLVPGSAAVKGATTVGKMAVRGAVEGGVLGLGESDADLTTLKGVEQAATDAGTGAAIGAVGGVVGGSIGGLVSKAKKLMSGNKTFSKDLNEIYSQTLLTTKENQTQILKELGFKNLDEFKGAIDAGPQALVKSAIKSKQIGLVKDEAVDLFDTMLDDGNKVQAVKWLMERTGIETKREAKQVLKDLLRNPETAGKELVSKLNLTQADIGKLAMNKFSNGINVTFKDALENPGEYAITAAAGLVGGPKASALVQLATKGNAVRKAIKSGGLKPGNKMHYLKLEMVKLKTQLKSKFAKFGAPALNKIGTHIDTMVAKKGVIPAAYKVFLEDGAKRWGTVGSGMIHTHLLEIDPKYRRLMKKELEGTGKTLLFNNKKKGTK